MGIFGSSTSFMLEYTIWLTDEAQVKTLQASDEAARAAAQAAHSGDSGLPQIQSPLSASSQFGAPISDPTGVLTSVPAPNKQTGPFVSPGITSSWFTSDKNFPVDQDGFKRKSGGWFGISFLFGNTVYYYWKRTFAYLAAAGTSGAGSGSGDGNAGTEAPPPPTPISTRRWIDGFELPSTGEQGVWAGSSVIVSRDASRHVDGFGAAFRDAGVNGYISHVVQTNFGGAPVPDATQSWERFYVRPRKLPSAAADLWRCLTNNPLQGTYLQIGPAGELIVGSTDTLGARTLHSTAGVLALNTWHRIDVLIKLPGFAGGARFTVYVNGEQKFDLTTPLGLIAPAVGHGSSAIGNYFNSFAGTSNGLEFDADDWVNSDLPTRTIVPPDTVGVITDPSWFNGSRNLLVRLTSVVSAGTWVPGSPTGFRYELAPLPPAAPGSNVSSSTALDTIVFGTDAARSVDGLAGQRGVGAFIVSLYNFAGGAADGRIGYKLASGAIVMLAQDNPNGVYGWRQVIYNGGVVTPPPLAGLQLYVEHSNSAQAEGIVGLFAECEVLGIWGDEDPRAPGSTTAPVEPIVAEAKNGIHNAPYPRTPWATSKIMAPAPVTIYGGTYVGTAAPFDLIFNAPIHWLFTRPLTGATEGSRWWSSMNVAHKSVFDGWQGDMQPDELIDPDFPPASGVDVQETQTLVRIGSNNFNNGVGVTYQYIAVSDAAMRFMFNTAFAHVSAGAQVDNALWHPRWTAEAGFFWHEVRGAGSNVSLWYKGVGHASAAASKVNSAETPNFAAFLLGAVRSHPSAHVVDTNVAVSLWRRDDLSNDPGVPRVVQLVSYVGDNAASRVISLTPTCGRRPLWCMVTPHNATAAIARDPSHTGTTSTNLDTTANAATGIIAGGIDAITVGLALNATGVTYDVFVLPGDTVAGNNGWSPNGTFNPVQPGVGGDPGGETFPDFTDFEGDNPFGGTGVPPSIVTDLTTDLDAVCSPFSHKLVNLALSRIGHTKQVTDLATELTVEATLARLHYTEDAATTLRDFPWAFATRYADPLTLVRGAAWATTALVQAWSATPTYSVGDVVRSGTTLYYCILAHLAHVPPNATYWSTTPPEDANDDWSYGYRVPTGLILARRLVQPGKARGFDPAPPPFRIGQDLNGDLIYTNQQDAILEYTYRPPCVASAGDPLFREAFAWRLAHSMCPGLSKDEKRQQYCWQMYLHTLTRATVPNANEQQPQSTPSGDAEWIEGRE